MISKKILMMEIQKQLVLASPLQIVKATIIAGIVPMIGLTKGIKFVQEQ
ncbi:hypothetical protein LZ578_11820 [Jeotgalibaca sp. MA1X17-3]|nr:hypothetical protein [Jeotgalibaca sp. MA1X17-3]UJF15624.1 hypothetical protein LZ578_11820 [Jeotgalibaca sp. MA1X17-3]